MTLSKRTLATTRRRLGTDQAGSINRPKPDFLIACLSIEAGAIETKAHYCAIGLIV